MSKALIIGSRGSRLALVQAESVASLIRERNPGLDISISKIKTEGDRNRRIPLERVSEVGMFVKKLEEALLDGTIDIAVHSFKDVPAETPPGLRLLATCERQDPGDALVARARLDDLPIGARIGTGSPRRAAQLTHYRPDLVVRGLRGNVDTRLRKVASGEFDGVILAAAAFRRLGWEDRVTEWLPVGRFLPAVGQGALAIEARAGDRETEAIVAPVNHLPTWQAVTAERAFLATLGGGCRAPIAALGTVTGNTLVVEGMVADPAGLRLLRSSEKGDAGSPQEVGTRLAHRLLDMGARDFVGAAEAA